MNYKGDRRPGVMRDLTRELERVVGPGDSEVASVSDSAWLRPWLLTPEKVAELDALLREAPSGIGLAAAEAFVRDRVAVWPALDADTEALGPPLNRRRLLGVTVLSLVSLGAGMLWGGTVGKWLMALAYALWVVAIILSRSAFDRGQKWAFIWSGLLLCTASLLSALHLSKEPWVIAGLAVALVGIVVADRVWWSRLPRDARSD